MAANTDDGALFLAKKFGGIVLIILGILGIAVGLEYRSTELSIGLAVLGGIALVCGVGLLVLKILRPTLSPDSWRPCGCLRITPCSGHPP